MARVDVTINRRTYSIQCDDGQESHVQRLARYIDQKVARLVTSVGQVGDARLLVMAGLLITDEFAELASRLETPEAASGEPSPFGDAAERTVLARAIESLAERVEGIAAGLEAD